MESVVTAQNDGVVVRWSADLVVCWSAGLLVCWSAGLGSGGDVMACSCWKDMVGLVVCTYPSLTTAAFFNNIEPPSHQTADNHATRQ
jgi:hypothetical protein